MASSGGGKFAAGTDVPVEKSRAEIEAVVQRYGAEQFASGWRGDAAFIGFALRDRQVRFVLPLPDRKAREFTHREQFVGNQNGGRKVEKERKPAEAAKAWEQACRQRWRALLLAIRAKLEAVEVGISTFDTEFMAQIVLPSGMTIGETVLPHLPRALEGGKLPPLLGKGGGE